MTKYRDNMYIIMFQNKYLEEQIENSYPGSGKEIERKGLSGHFAMDVKIISPTEAEDLQLKKRSGPGRRRPGYSQRGGQIYYYGGKLRP